MLKKIKQSYHSLVSGTAGQRFTRYHERRKREVRKHGTAKAALYIGLGAALLVVGLLLSIPPGIPGFLLWLPALGLLVTQFKPLAVFLDRTEVYVRRLFGIQRPRSGSRDS